MSATWSPQPLRPLARAAGHVVEAERLGSVDALEPDVLLGQRDLDLLTEDLGVEEVLDADPQAPVFVGVGGTDAATGGADLKLPEAPLAGLVEGDVPRHHQVRIAGDPDRARRDTSRLELVELADQDSGIDDAPRAEHAERVRVEDAGRYVMELVRLPVAR